MGLIEGVTGGNFTMKSFLTFAARQNYSNDQMKKHEMGSACGTLGAEEMCIQAFARKR